MESIDNIITFEVKKEIADRYFGFRRIIEKDTGEYLEGINKARTIFNETIGNDLNCMYTLLSNDTLIDTFLATTGLKKRYCQPSQSPSSPEGFTEMAKQKCRGLTRKGCIRNMFYDIYVSLHNHITEYNQIYSRLVENHDTIEAQITLFYRKNDIHSIVHFLRSLGSGHPDISPVIFDAENGTSLEEKLNEPKLSPNVALKMLSAAKLSNAPSSTAGLSPWNRLVADVMLIDSIPE